MEFDAVIREPVVTKLYEESDRGFHVAERSYGVDFDEERESHIDDNLNGLRAENKNRTAETDDVRDKDSPTESNADATRTKLQTDVVEDYVIKNQHMYHLYCPCCGKDITNIVKVVRKSEIQQNTERKDVILWFPVRIPLPFPFVFGRKDQKGKEKVDSRSVLIRVLDIRNWRLKTVVQNFLWWFLHIVSLLLRYIIGSLFLYVFALWFLFISPEALPSTCSSHFISVFALLFVAILAMWFQFNPGHNEKKGSNKPSHPFGDNEEENRTEPSRVSKHNVTAELGPAGSNETGGKIEILRSIVYGGLIESITSLGIVSSAAGSGASTLKIFVMGLANVFSGLTLIVHNLLELKNNKPKRRAIDEEGEEEEDRYEQVLGRRERFYLHVFVVIVSFIFFGVIPPLVYSFSFQRDENRNYRATAVITASLVCIIALAIAKVYVSKTKEYYKTVFRYTKVAMGASSVSYIIGHFVNNLFEKFGLYDDDSAEARPR